MIISPLGDKGIRIEFGREISTGTNDKIRKFLFGFNQEPIAGVRELTPAYSTVTIFYDPMIITYSQLEQKVMEILENVEELELPPPMCIHIPTCYGGEFGPDLRGVANYHHLSEEEVISIHSDSTYFIYMIGFSPGFPYLGNMSERIATPRLESPRSKVPAGSVGIAGAQTGIYSVETPGGWQIIGRTPLRLFELKKDPPILLRAGNYVRFDPISTEEYEKIEGEIKVGTYKPLVRPFK